MFTQYLFEEDVEHVNLYLSVDDNLEKLLLVREFVQLFFQAHQTDKRKFTNKVRIRTN